MEVTVEIDRKLHFEGLLGLRDRVTKVTILLPKNYPE